MNEAKIMSEAEQVGQLDTYMQQTKKALKSMSKNDLIRAVSALLLDKQMLTNQLQRLQSQKVTENAKTT